MVKLKLFMLPKLVKINKEFIEKEVIKTKDRKGNEKK